MHHTCNNYFYNLHLWSNCKCIIYTWWTHTVCNVTFSTVLHLSETFREESTMVLKIQVVTVVLCSIEAFMILPNICLKHTLPRNIKVVVSGSRFYKVIKKRKTETIFSLVLKHIHRSIWICSQNAHNKVNVGCSVLQRWNIKSCIRFVQKRADTTYQPLQHLHYV